VAVGGTGVAVGGTGVAFGGGVAVGAGVGFGPQPAATRISKSEKTNVNFIMYLIFSSL
jgi:hypothetical protein